MAGVVALAFLAVAGATSANTATAGATSASAANPPIGHVFVIVLENESASTTFGAGSPAPYLSTTLRSEGAYLPNYYAVGHESNDNYIAMISGQAPTAQNQADCQFYDNLEPGTIGSYGQAEGTGCVYPADVPTIADQLTASGLTWRDYNESMGADPTREASECGHPGINSVDNTQKATATDEYATRHDPFVYFHSIIDDTALCDSHVVNLDLLPHDLGSAIDTPNYVFITPDLCDDGHDSPCANGQPGGLAQADAFLRQWVPQITSSPAFTQQHGLLIITFDEADTSDTSACCGEIPGPDSPEPGVNGPGGGDIGAVLLSPCIAPGTVSTVPYNHYSMLRSVEDIFGLPHLGYAQLARRDLVRLGHLQPTVHGNRVRATATGDAGPCAGDRVERRRRPADPDQLECERRRRRVHGPGPADELVHERVADAADFDRAALAEVRRPPRSDLRVPGARGQRGRRPRRVVERDHHRPVRATPCGQPLPRRVACAPTPRRLGRPRDPQLDSGRGVHAPLCRRRNRRDRRALSARRPRPPHVRWPQPHDRPPLRTHTRPAGAVPRARSTWAPPPHAPRSERHGRARGLRARVAPRLTAGPETCRWRDQDSNLGRLSREIYSLVPLTARESRRGP